MCASKSFNFLPFSDWIFRAIWQQRSKNSPIFLKSWNIWNLQIPFKSSIKLTNVHRIHTIHPYSQYLQLHYWFYVKNVFYRFNPAVPVRFQSSWVHPRVVMAGAPTRTPPGLRAEASPGREGHLHPEHMGSMYRTFICWDWNAKSSLMDKAALQWVPGALHTLARSLHPFTKSSQLFTQHCLKQLCFPWFTSGTPMFRMAQWFPNLAPPCTALRFKVIEAASPWSSMSSASICESLGHLMSWMSWTEAETEKDVAGLPIRNCWKLENNVNLMNKEALVETSRRSSPALNLHKLTSGFVFETWQEPLGFGVSLSIWQEDTRNMKKLHEFHFSAPTFDFPQPSQRKAYAA